MNSDLGEPEPAQQGLRSRRVVVAAAAGLVLLLAIVALIVVSRAKDDRSSADLTVGWGGSEGDSSCTYVPKEHTVEAKLTIDGAAGGHDRVTVVVTAYADENTSQPVGSSSRTVEIEGTVHIPLVISIPVVGTPHVGEDDVAACALQVDY